MKTSYLDSEILLKSTELVLCPEHLEKIAARLAEKGWRTEQKENHLTLLYPSEFEWLPDDAACGYLWRSQDEWHWSVHSSRWWMLFGGSNDAPHLKDQLLGAIKETLDELNL
jgi:hypothetical protein